MNGRQARLVSTVVFGVVIGLGVSPAVDGQTLRITSVWFEETADRHEQVEFYAYASGRLVGEPGPLKHVLIYTCPWSNEGGLETVCGSGNR